MIKYTFLQFLKEHIFQVPVLVFLLVVDATLLSAEYNFDQCDVTMLGGWFFTQFVYLIIMLVQWRELKRKRETDENS